tara:strand:+ start:4214 stop:4468 length:255 start_codon:yes stop_codon:yes gene_type:complete
MKVIKLFQSHDKLIKNKINGILDAMSSTDDEYATYLIDQLIEYIEINYDGLYIDNAVYKLLEAKFWLDQCELSYQATEEIEEKK